MRANPFWIPLLVIVTLLGSIGLAQAASVWTTSGRTAVDYENMTPADLKGWMTLQQVLDGLKMSQTDLYAIAKIPADVPPTTALKDLEGLVPGFEITTLRDTLNAKTSSDTNPGNAPVESTPQATVQITPTPQAQATVHVTPTPLPAGQILPADQIKGRMTLQEVSDQCAVPLDRLLAALNLDAGTNPNTALKDLVNAGTLSEIAAVQSAVAELQK